MPETRLRHEDRQLKVFLDDRDYGPFAITEASENSDIQVQRTKYMGNKIPYVDGSDMGFRVNFTCEVIPGTKNPSDAFDDFREALNARQSSARVRVVDSWIEPGSNARRGYRYEGGVINVNRSSRSGDPVQFQVTVDAPKRERL